MQSGGCTAWHTAYAVWFEPSACVADHRSPIRYPLNRPTAVLPRRCPRFVQPPRCQLHRRQPSQSDRVRETARNSGRYPLNRQQPTRSEPMMRVLFLLPAFSIAVSACVSRPESIRGTVTPYERYVELDCLGLDLKMADTKAELDHLSKMQDDKATADAVSVLLIFVVPGIRSAGDDHEVDIARLKGEVEAIEDCAAQAQVLARLRAASRLTSVDEPWRRLAMCTVIAVDQERRCLRRQR